MGEGALFSALSALVTLGVACLFGIELIQTIDLYSSNLYVNIVNIIHANHQICKSSTKEPVITIIERCIDEKQYILIV